jgi:HEPN domain-containing protein
MPDRSKDWFAQAQRDLRHAVHACDSGDHGMPGDYYTKKDAQEAIANAEQIIRFCEGLLR